MWVQYKYFSMSKGGPVLPYPLQLTLKCCPAGGNLRALLTTRSTFAPLLTLLSWRASTLPKQCQGKASYLVWPQHHRADPGLAELMLCKVWICCRLCCPCVLAWCHARRQASSVIRVALPCLSLGCVIGLRYALVMVNNNHCCRGWKTYFYGFLAFSTSLARLEVEKLMFSELFSWASGSGQMKAPSSPPIFKYQWSRVWNRALAWGIFHAHLWGQLWGQGSGMLDTWRDTGCSLACACWKRAGMWHPVLQAAGEQGLT